MRMLGGLLSEMLTSFQEIRAGSSENAELEEQIAEQSFTKGSKHHHQPNSGRVPNCHKCSRCKWVGQPDYMINTFDLPVGVFDMPNPYRYSIFDRYRYFAKFPYPYRYQEFTKQEKKKKLD